MADYKSIADDKQLDRLRRLATDLEGVRVLHVNSTANGGGVAEILQSLVPLSNILGINTDWRVMEADKLFFDVTKTMHNGLQGQDVVLADAMKTTYRRETQRNAAALTDEYDIIVLHDPQTLGMAKDLADRFPDTQLIWRCHIDLTAASEPCLQFLADDIRHVDHVVFSRPEYGRDFDLPTTVIHPSIDPLSEKNRPLDPDEIAAERDRLAPIDFTDDSPVITQVSRFDPWKDQFGVIDAYRQVKTSFPSAQLLLAGGMADDDPEGVEIYERVADETADDPDIHLLTNEPDTTINFLQRKSDIVVQKSIREGFGLVVSEALWKKTPVIGSRVGGIPLQLDDGTNGHLISPDAADILVDRLEGLLTADARRRQLGKHGRETVREQFLLPRHLLDYCELFRVVQTKASRTTESLAE
ncbi:glycosyltransferase [Natronococcus pandeyae]|uniref:glycosyltransferase n=1 Tax=Natronococcus pandeyae TaxID=2055836 RepID=UPI001F42384C|nr:glycosyltransferase [Natronococcus pandeyae]